MDLSKIFSGRRTVAVVSMTLIMAGCTGTHDMGASRKIPQAPLQPENEETPPVVTAFKAAKASHMGDGMQVTGVPLNKGTVVASAVSPNGNKSEMSVITYNPDNGLFWGAAVTGHDDGRNDGGHIERGVRLISGAQIIPDEKSTLTFGGCVEYSQTGTTFIGQDGKRYIERDSLKGDYNICAFAQYERDVDWFSGGGPFDRLLRGPRQ